MPRRRWGTGSVYRRRSDNRWVGAVRDRGRRRPVYGRSKAEVLGKLAELRLSIARGDAIPDGRLTVGRQLIAWLAGKKGTVAPTSWVRYEQHIRLHLAALAGVPLHRLTPEDVRGLVRDMTAAGKAPVRAGHPAHPPLGAGARGRPRAARSQRDDRRGTTAASSQSQHPGTAGAGSSPPHRCQPGRSPGSVVVAHGGHRPPYGGGSGVALAGCGPAVWTARRVGFTPQPATLSAHGETARDHGPQDRRGSTHRGIARVRGRRPFVPSPSGRPAPKRRRPALHSCRWAAHEPVDRAAGLRCCLWQSRPATDAAPRPPTHRGDAPPRFGSVSG